MKKENSNIPAPSPPKLPGYTADCALPPSDIVASIGYSGIRYYGSPPAAPGGKDAKP